MPQKSDLLKALEGNVIRENIERVLKEYSKAREKSLAGHPLGGLLRQTFPEDLKKLVDVPKRYQFVGSAGQGNWARCPWVAVLDIFITDSVQSGYYPVYLFREDMKGVYLSLNQGVTEIRKKYKEDPKKVLKLRALDFRAQIGSDPARFKEKVINLATTSPLELAAFYEAGNIYSTYYDALDLPSEQKIIEDFREILNLYSLLSYNENIKLSGSEVEEDGQERLMGIEDLRKFREHKRIERNASLSNRAKVIHGYDCKACGFNFGKYYGKLGEKFIEAHHLVPIAQLKGKVVELDPRKDFTVLCSNCHRMIHRTGEPENVNEFKKNLILEKH